MGMDFNTLRSIAEGCGKAKQKGNENCFSCLCPAHDDSAPSLLIWINSETNKLGFKCLTKCTYEAIESALKNKGLMETSKKQTQESRKRAPLSIVSPDDKVTNYEYRNEIGEVEYTSRRVDFKDGGKTFQICHIDDNGKEAFGYKSINGKKRRILYRLPEILASVENDTLIMVCEGEKNVEDVMSLGIPDLVATTNPNGSQSWGSVDSSHLVGRRLILIEDNDEKKPGDDSTPGGKWIDAITKSLKTKAKSIAHLKFSEMGAKADISDFIAIDRISAKERVIARINSAKWIKEPPKPGEWVIPAERESASYEDCKSLILSIPIIKRVVLDALEQELFYQNAKTEQWEFLANILGTIKSSAREHGEFFKPLEMFPDHMDRWRTMDSKPELRVDIPEWDNVDRIKQQCEIFTFNNVSKTTAHQLICHWGAGIFKRLANPYTQTPMLILQSWQGAGKDSVIESWVQGLKDYRRDFPLNEDTKADELLKMLHTALVFVIPEFDKGARVDPAFLKDVIFKTYTDVRLAYDKRPAHRTTHCTFISSCNNTNVFFDETGNRRFWMLECDYLALGHFVSEDGLKMGNGVPMETYPGGWMSANADEERMQILAQFKELANRGFSASAPAIAEINKYMMAQVPESIDSQIWREWEVSAESLLPVARTPDGIGLVDGDSEEVKKIIKNIRERFKRSDMVIRRILNKKFSAEGQRPRVNGIKRTCFKQTTKPMEDDWENPF